MIHDVCRMTRSKVKVRVRQLRKMADFKVYLRRYVITRQWTETPIIHMRPTDSSILQPHYCRQADLSSLRRQSLEQSPYTSHLNTVTHGFATAS